MFTGDGVESIADQCLILSIDRRPRVLRRTEEYRKARKLESLPDQLLERHIDDVGEIFLRTSGLVAGLLHGLV